MPFLFEVVLAASGTSDQGVWGAFAPFHGGSNDNIGRRGRLRWPEIVLQKEQTSVAIQFIGGVVDISEQFMTGVVDTGEQFIAGVSDTIDNIFPQCHGYRSEITKNRKSKILYQTPFKLGNKPTRVSSSLDFGLCGQDLYRNLSRPGPWKKSWICVSVLTDKKST